MQLLARLLLDRRVAWSVVFLTGLVVVASVLLAGRIRQDDDVLAFLPRGNAEIATFQEINRRFGGLDVALVGVEVDDAFSPEALGSLRAATDAIRETPGVEHVLSLANVEDFTPDPMGGIRTANLVEAVPAGDAEAVALREKVLSRDHVVGTLVSADARAYVMVVFLTYGGDRRATTGRISDAMAAAFPGATVHYGGSPYISDYIYRTTQADMKRLTPWAVGAIVLLMMLAFRDWRGVLLGLGSTGIGILATHALMSALDVPLNVVLGSMPVILFAVGSAYGIHILHRYYWHAQAMPRDEAVAHTLVTTGPTVLTAGFTTAIGLLSFVVMDIAPLQAFGAFTAFGVLVTLGLSVTFVPAVIVLLGLPPRPAGADALGRFWVGLVGAVRRHRLAVGSVVAVVFVAGAVSTARVDSRMDSAAFYAKGSPPDRADAFLRGRFGGSQFVQVRVAGDVSDPLVLRELRALADRLAAIPGVSRVQHVGDVIAAVNLAMEGQERIPDTPEKVGQLYGFLTGNGSVRQLVSDDRAQALLHVRLSADGLDATEAALAAVEAEVAASAPRGLRAVAPAADAAAAERRAAQTAARVVAIARALGAPVPAATAEAQVAAALAAGRGPGADRLAVQQDLLRWLGSDENFVPLTEPERLSIAAAVMALGPSPAPEALGPAVEGAFGRPVDRRDVDDLLLGLDTPLGEIWRRRAAESRAVAVLAAAGVGPAPGPTGALLVPRVASTLLDLDAPTVAVVDPAGPVALSWDVSGTPVLNRGLSTSVMGNQVKSLVFALGLVAALLAVRFRSVPAGLLASAPMAVALVVVYGVMGALHIRLDIGTSMLASIVIGAGVDYAVHLLSNWYAGDGESADQGAARAAARTGTAIWTNALMVAVGFFVLTFGEAQPLKNVGSLTAAATLAAALATFFVVPVLAQRRRYTRLADAVDPADAATGLAAAPLHDRSGVTP
jgi:predicted RND superfamily exporter protein